MAESEVPTEEEILRATLLSPSSLSNIISLKEFVELFPASLQGHPQVPALYRALQHQRALDLDLIRGNIYTEVKRGERLQREWLRTRLKGSDGVEALSVDDPIGRREIIEKHDAVMSGIVYPHLREGVFQPHTLSTIVPALDNAIASIQDEVSEMAAEADQLQAQLEANIGDLSDLRYGKLSRADVRKEIIESLQALASECDSKGASSIAFESQKDA